MAKQGRKRRFGRPRTEERIDLTGVNWLHSNVELAALLGVSVMTVWRMRRRMGKHNPPRKPKAPPDPKWNDVDWRKQDCQIADDMRVLSRRVAEHRHRLKRPKAERHMQRRRPGSVKRAQYWIRSNMGLARVLTTAQVAFYAGVKRWAVREALHREGIWTRDHLTLSELPINWNLPNSIIGDIWQIAEGHVARIRRNHRFCKPVYDARRSEQPPAYKQAITREREKAKHHVSDNGTHEVAGRRTVRRNRHGGRVGREVA